MIELTLLIPLTIGIVEVIKRATKIDTRYIPLIAVIVGVTLAYALSIEILTMTFLPGIIAGLSAVGLWDVTKRTITILNKK